METSAILDELETLLEEERLGIRKLHGQRIEAIAQKKLGLMKRLDATLEIRKAEHAPRFKEIVRRLRHNGVLLFHARSVLVEASRIRRARLASASVTPAPMTKARERRISVVG
jgi:flagellar biosynthesis/type III secretory pathway chaperone